MLLIMIITLKKHFLNIKKWCMIYLVVLLETVLDLHIMSMLLFILIAIASGVVGGVAMVVGVAITVVLIVRL